MTIGTEQISSSHIMATALKNDSTVVSPIPGFWIITLRNTRNIKNTSFHNLAKGVVEGLGTFWARRQSLAQ